MRTYSLLYRKGTVTSFLLLFILAACGTNHVSTIGNGGLPVSTGTTQVTTHTGDSITPAPSIKLGPQPCPASVATPGYWHTLAGEQANINTIESVTCANLLGKAILQALVNVRINGTGHYLNVYVYDTISSANPTRIFKLEGLEHADALISNYNTILTGEVDEQSSTNINARAQGGEAALVRDLYREFKWSESAATFVPVVFPGIFPDLTRYQAEADQIQVNQGHQPWKLDAAMTAHALAVSMLKWSTSATTNIVSGGGQHDSAAVVSVKSAAPGSNIIQVTMTRLEGNTNGGIWIATGVTTGGMSLTTPAALAHLTSPTTVKGTGDAFEGKVGSVAVLDHTYTDIGHADANGTTGPTTFSSTVSYSSSVTNGLDEGVVALYSYSNADGSIAGAVLIKVLLA